MTGVWLVLAAIPAEATDRHPSSRARWLYIQRLCEFDFEFSAGTVDRLSAMMEEVSIIATIRGTGDEAPNWRNGMTPDSEWVAALREREHLSNCARTARNATKEALLGDLTHVSSKALAEVHPLRNRAVNRTYQVMSETEGALYHLLRGRDA